MTITEFLLERIAEDEAWAKREERAAIRTHHLGRPGPYLPNHYARALAQCDAHRRIVSDCAEYEGPETDGLSGRILRGLAAVYADHPDYDTAWMPDA